MGYNVLSLQFYTEIILIILLTVTLFFNIIEAEERFSCSIPQTACNLFPKYILSMWLIVMSTLQHSIKMEELFNMDMFLYKQLPELQKVFFAEGSVLLSPCRTVLAIMRDIHLLVCL